VKGRATFGKLSRVTSIGIGHDQRAVNGSLRDQPRERSEVGDVRSYGRLWLNLTI